MVSTKAAPALSGIRRRIKNMPRKSHIAATVPGAILASSIATRLRSFAPMRQNKPPTIMLDRIGTPRIQPIFVIDERKSR